MTEFNPNCGRCGMLNSRGFCSLTACRFPSNVIVVEPKVIRGMMVNPQIEKPQTKADRIRAMTDEGLAEWIETIASCDCCQKAWSRGKCRGADGTSHASCKLKWLDWLKREVEE